MWTRVQDMVNWCIYALVWTQPLCDRRRFLEWVFSDGDCAGYLWLYLAGWVGVPALQLLFYEALERGVWPSLLRYKLQTRRPTTEEKNAIASQRIGFIVNAVGLYVLLYVYLHTYCDPKSLAKWTLLQIESVPDRWTMCAQIATSLFASSTLFYFCHRLFHSGFLYRFHKRHHEFHMPVPLSVRHVHLVDFFLAIAMVYVPCALFSDIHILTFLLINVIGMVHGFYEHCGFDLPVPVFQFIPFGSHVVAHDHHHRFGDGNYGAFWTFWDVCLNTVTNKKPL